MKRTALRAGKALQFLGALAAILALMAVVAVTVVPRVLGWESVVVLTGSMEPTIPVGGLAFLAPVHPEEVKVGDVISYRLGNSRVTHRVVELGTDAQGALGFKTKGDANNDADAGMVPASSVVSREVWTVPYAGRVSNFMRSREGFKLLIFAPAIVIVASSLFSISAEMNKQRRKAAA
jgi:signal peptidase